MQVTTVVHLCVHHSRRHVQKTALHNTLHHPPVLTSVHLLFHKAMSLGVGFDIDAPWNCFWTRLLTVLTITTPREITVASLSTARMPILFNPFYYSIAKVLKIFTDQPICPLPVPELSHLMVEILESRKQICSSCPNYLFSLHCPMLPLSWSHPFKLKFKSAPI